MKSLRCRVNPNHEQYVEFRDDSGRFLWPDELATLISTTWDGPVRMGMTGPERSMLYRLASELQLSVEELRGLTAASFQFGETTKVRVAGGVGGRPTRLLTLRRETARDLGSFLIVPEPDQPVFRIPNELSEMLRADLQAASANTVRGNQTLNAGAAKSNRPRDRQP